ncbi:MAG: Alpha/beta hydrolase fold-3 domain protein [Frankiales bacterium]|nr:Alpha/beta hydrolase fold-3 domain protein [Frankiales bacterium]
MPLDHQIAAFLPFLQGAPDLQDLPPSVIRTSFRTLTVDMRNPASLPPVRSREDTTYPAPEGARAARIYRPEASGPVPTVLFVHGGAFFMGDIDTHEDHAMALCHDVGAVVVSVDYRLAPEDPFPAAHLDVVAALRHVVSTVADLGGDPSRIAVAGDSAGANLCAGAAIVARDESLPLKAQLLLYPVTDFVDSDRHSSRVENADGFFLTEADMRCSERWYAADPGDPRASVLDHPDLTGVAPAIIATAEYDPLRDEGIAYAAALEKAGVRVLHRHYETLIHGFFGMGQLSAACAAAVHELSTDLKELLG